MLGRLVALEGIDKCGKHTQADLIRIWLESIGLQVKIISFPDYNTPIGRLIKSFLSGTYLASPEVRQLLYAANRWERRNEIVDWLSNGFIVIADRYIPSGLAYGLANNLPLSWMTCIEQGLPEADLVIVIDIPVEISLKRLEGNEDMYERDIDFLSRVRQCYIKLADKFNWIVIDGNRSKEDVFNDIRRAILEFILKDV